MKAYKIELLVLDFDQLGGDEIKSVFENSRYPNDCISPSAMRITEADIGPWSDDNPLNSGKTRAAEYARIFPSEASSSMANNWLPIEAAPKDGQYVLTCGRKYQSEHEGFWYESAFYRASSGLFDYLDSGDVEHYQPTHWMPSPQPPQ